MIRVAIPRSGFYSRGSAGGPLILSFASLFVRVPRYSVYVHNVAEASASRPRNSVRELLVGTRRLSSPHRSDRRLPKLGSELRDGTCSRKQLLHLLLLPTPGESLLAFDEDEAKRPYQTTDAR